MGRKIIVSLILFFTLMTPNIVSQNTYKLTDSSQISLLTVTPSDEEVYTLFGHTAIRVKDESLSLDLVFNYGLFNYNSPNFIYRFIKGETDYQVGASPYDYFIIEYRLRGVGVYEQLLDLTTSDKQQIWNALIENIKPENKEYRYNFLYDNCATRVRDIIANNINETIEYDKSEKQQSYRDLIHECTILNPWTQFGIDIIIGSGADKVITKSQKDFLPRYLSNDFKNAVLTDENREKHKLVANSNFILEPTDNIAKILYDYYSHSESVYDNKISRITPPLLVGIALLIVVSLISYYSYQKDRIALGKIVDTLLFFLSGLAGCIICFLWFISVHPCVDANWNLVWLNPLQTLAAFLFFVKPLQKYSYYYHFINFAIVSLFLLAWSLIPQQLEIAFIPYILTLIVRSGMNILQYKKFSRAHQALI